MSVIGVSPVFMFEKMRTEVIRHVMSVPGERREGNGLACRSKEETVLERSHTTTGALKESKLSGRREKWRTEKTGVKMDLSMEATGDGIRFNLEKSACENAGASTG